MGRRKARTSRCCDLTVSMFRGRANTLIPWRCPSRRSNQKVTEERDRDRDREKRQQQDRGQRQHGKRRAAVQACAQRTLPPCVFSLSPWERATVREPPWHSRGHDKPSPPP